MLNSIKRILLLSDTLRPVVNKGIMFGLLYSAVSGVPILILLIFIKQLIRNTLTPSSLIMLTVLLIVDFIFQYFLSFKEISINSSAGYDIIAKERKSMSIFLRKIPMGEFLGESLGKIQSIVIGEMTQIELYAMQMVSKVIGNISFLCFTALLLICINPIVGACFFIGLPIAVIVNFVLQKKQRNCARKHLKAQEQLINKTVEYIQGIETFRSYNSEDTCKSGIEEEFNEYAQNSIHSEARLIPWMKSHSFFLYIGIPFAMFVGSVLLSKESIQLSSVLLFAMVSTLIYQPLENLSANAGIMKGMEESLNRLDELKGQRIMKNQGRKNNFTNYNVRFEEVGFSYGENFKLSNVTFEAPENTFTAIVGPSGSGKSTVAKLLMRYWDVNSGKIIIGEKDIQEYSISKLMDSIAVVFQDNFLFHDTIAQNIGMGKENVTMKEIQMAAKLACCHDFIMNLPDGYDTVINEGGKSLSGGERQRIAIARAILKDAPIIILDEATSGIDPINEYEIQKGLQKLIKNKTVFLITHKLNMAEAADQILVIKDGKIEAAGTHKELIAQKGLYSVMWESEKNTESWRIKENKYDGV